MFLILNGILDANLEFSEDNGFFFIDVITK